MSWRNIFWEDAVPADVDSALRMWGGKDVTPSLAYIEDGPILYRVRVPAVEGEDRVRIDIAWSYYPQDGAAWPPVSVTLGSYDAAGRPNAMYVYAGSSLYEARDAFSRFAWAFWSEDDDPPPGVVHGAGGLREVLAGAYGKEPSEEIDVALDHAEELGRRVYFVPSYAGPWAVVYGRKDPEVPLPAAGPLYHAAGKLIRRVANAIPGPRRR